MKCTTEGSKVDKYTGTEELEQTGAFELKSETEVTEKT